MKTHTPVPAARRCGVTVLICHAVLFIIVVGTGAAAGPCPVVCGDEFSPNPSTPQVAAFAVELDVLTQPLPNYRINAQKWGRRFQELGLVATFRDGRPGERTRIENLDIIDPPTTIIVGIMEPDGRILILNQRVSIIDPRPLLHLITQVRRYGAAGPPEASPTWGLTDEQFSFVTQALAEPVTEPVVLRTAVEAIDSLKLPSIFQLRFDESARLRAFESAAETGVSAESLTGISKGTAMAIVLSQYGLGFRPISGEQAGHYTIEIHAGGEASNLWPVGWKTKEALISVLPDLYRSIEFELDAVEVTGLIAVIAQRLQLKHFYSSHELQQAGIDVEQLKYSRKLDKLTPARMLLLLGDKFKMGLDVRSDEAGQCFVWVTTASEFAAFRTRFAHIIPGKR